MFTLFNSSKCLNICLSLNIYSGLCFFLKWKMAHMQIILFSKCASVWTATSFRRALRSSRGFSVFQSVRKEDLHVLQRTILSPPPPVLLTIFTAHLTHLVVRKGGSEITLRSCKIIKHISYLKLKKLKPTFMRLFMGKCIR